MSADVNQLQTFFYPYVQHLVMGPVTIIAAMVLLWFQIGWATFIALAILLVYTPLICIIVGKLSSYRREMLKYSDEASWFCCLGKDKLFKGLGRGLRSGGSVEPWHLHSGQCTVSSGYVSMGNCKQYK